MIADYFFVRRGELDAERPLPARRRLRVSPAASTGSRWRALASAWRPACPGFLAALRGVPGDCRSSATMYNWAWFVGFAAVRVDLRRWNASRSAGAAAGREQLVPSRNALTDEQLASELRRHRAAAHERRGAARGQQMPVLLRRPLHHRVSHAHRRPRVHQEDRQRESARFGPRDSGRQSVWALLRPGMSGRGAVRGRVRPERSRRAADQDRSAAAACDRQGAGAASGSCSSPADRPASAWRSSAPVLPVSRARATCGAAGTR